MNLGSRFCFNPLNSSASFTLSCLKEYRADQKCMCKRSRIKLACSLNSSAGRSVHSHEKREISWQPKVVFSKGLLDLRKKNCYSNLWPVSRALLYTFAAPFSLNTGQQGRQAPVHVDGISFRRRRVSCMTRCCQASSLETTIFPVEQVGTTLPRPNLR